MELYIVTDRKASRGRDHMSMVRAALDGGADVIQLRDKDRRGATFMPWPGKWPPSSTRPEPGS